MSPQFLIEYLSRDGEPMLLSDLGVDYLTTLGLPLVQAHRPFRVEATALISKGGNPYFEYRQGKIPLPDGLHTRLRVGGVDVVLGEERKSKKGNPTREGGTIVTVEGTPYEVTAFITKTSTSYWVKVHAHKATGKRLSAPTSPIIGGKIV